MLVHGVASQECGCCKIILMKVSSDLSSVCAFRCIVIAGLHISISDYLLNVVGKYLGS